MVDKSSKNRASILIVLGIFAALWVMINAGNLITTGLVYIVIGAIAIFFYREWDSIGNKGFLEGIDANFIKDAGIGLIAALGFIILGTISPFIGAIGIPQVQSIAGTLGRFLIIVVAAPIMEEFLFREFLQDFFENKLFKLPFFVAAIITSILFALFHYTAYGASLSAAQGSFISAGIAGMVFAYLNKYTNSHIGNIACHMALNFYLGFVTLGVILG